MTELDKNLFIIFKDNKLDNIVNCLHIFSYLYDYQITSKNSNTEGQICLNNMFFKLRNLFLVHIVKLVDQELCMLIGSDALLLIPTESLLQIQMNERSHNHLYKVLYSIGIL